MKQPVDIETTTIPGMTEWVLGVLAFGMLTMAVALWDRI